MARDEVKALEQQLLRLRLEFEAEKIAIDMVLRRLKAAGLISAEPIEKLLDQAPPGRDADSDLFAAVFHARMLQIHELLTKPPDAAD